MIKFKNAIVYQLNNPFSFSRSELENALSSLSFISCGDLDQSKIGWKAPDPQQPDNLVYEMRGQFLLCFCKEEKILPAAVIKQHLDEKLEKLENASGQKLKKSEKVRIKDEVIQSLLPQAFSKQSHTQIWIYPQQNLIFVDSASAKRAEDALSLLRKSLGSLSVVPFKRETPIENTLTQWVLTKDFPSTFVALDEFELTEVGTKATIRCKGQDIESNEILNLIKNGMQITKLKLEWQNEIQFILTQDAVLKRLSYSDVSEEEKNEKNIDDIDAEFLLMSGKISLLFSSLWR